MSRLEPRFLTQSDRAFLRDRLQQSDNLDFLLRAVCQFLRDLLPGGIEQPRDSLETAGRTLSESILTKLRSQYPKESYRSDADLVRVYPDRAGTLLSQALTLAVNQWTEDHIRLPLESQGRLERLLPKFANLPRGRRTYMSETLRQLGFLADYEKATRSLSPTNRRGFTRPALESLFGPLSPERYNKLRSMSRSNVALEFARRAVGDRPEVGMDRARVIRRKALLLKSRLDRAEEVRAKAAQATETNNPLALPQGARSFPRGEAQAASGSVAPTPDGMAGGPRGSRSPGQFPKPLRTRKTSA